MYGNYDTASSATNAAGDITYLIVMLIIYVACVVGYWKVFEKADKPGWHSIIPFLNSYDLFEIGGVKGGYSFLILIPFVGWLIYLFFAVKSYIGISRAFGKGDAYAVLLFFLSPIGFILLGFGKDTYNASLMTAAKNTATNNQPQTNNEPNAQVNQASSVNPTTPSSPINQNSQVSQVSQVNNSNSSPVNTVNSQPQNNVQNTDNNQPNNM